MQKQFSIDHWLAREGKKEWAKEIPSYRNRSNEMVIRGSTMHSHITVADCYYAPGRWRWWNWYLWLDCVWHNTQSAKEINLIPAVVMQFCNIPSVGLGRISWLDGMHQLFWLFFLQNCLLRIANYTRHTTLDRKCHFWTRVGIRILHLSMHLECPLFLWQQFHCQRNIIHKLLVALDSSWHRQQSHSFIRCGVVSGRALFWSSSESYQNHSCTSSSSTTTASPFRYVLLATLLLHFNSIHSTAKQIKCNLNSIVCGRRVC